MTPLNVLTFNIHEGGGDRLPAIAAVIRAQQPDFVALLEVLGALADRCHLLVGDLNALGPGDPVGLPPRGETKRGDAAAGAPRLAMRRIADAGYVDCYHRLHPAAAGFTYPAQAPWLRLDYVFASPGLVVQLAACDVVDTDAARRASDHLPVWATFTSRVAGAR
jgi:endonuclease/exonuclease/phosphatase family metal-dependent hydrolase